VKYFAQSTSKLRVLVGVLVAVVVASMLTLGMSGTAFATVGHDFTVMVTTKTGLPLRGVTIYAL
jgi:hypothetical protein